MDTGRRTEWLENYLDEHAIADRLADATHRTTSTTYLTNSYHSLAVVAHRTGSNSRGGSQLPNPTAYQ